MIKRKEKRGRALVLTQDPFVFVCVLSLSFIPRPYREQVREALTDKSLSFHTRAHFFRENVHARFY
jgi:hypothetical protein